MPDLYYSERNLLQAAAEGKQITEAEIRVLTDRLERLRDRNRKLRAAIAAIRVGCPNQPTDHPCDGMFTRIIGICRDVMRDEDSSSPLPPTRGRDD